MANNGLIEWKPIWTAPKDETSVLLLCDGEIIQGYWSWGEWCQNIISTNYDVSSPVFECCPSDWAPIPWQTFE